MSNNCQISPRTTDNSNTQVIKSIPVQAESDEHLLKLWLHGRSKHTQRAYTKDVSSFLGFVQKEIRLITLGDLQDYSEHLFEKDLCQGSIRRALASIKSMFGFAHRIGYIQFDIGRPLRVPTPKDALAKRILSEEEIQTIIDSIENARNRLIVKTLYYTGLRISELVSLKWADIQSRENTGQITVQGKGGKTNNILVPEHLFVDLMIFRRLADEDSPVFRSRNGGHLNSDHVRKVLKKIAVKAIGKGATPHWYRHSHAFHALENGCPIHLVQKQLNHSSLAITGRYLHARPSESSSKYLK